MVTFRGQVREMTDNCRRMLAHRTEVEKNALEGTLSKQPKSRI
jgi:hypothetical protein